MKKVITLLLLSFMLITSFVGCENRSIADADANSGFVDSEYIDLVSIEVDENYAYEILYDKHTGVMYLVVKGYASGMMTPIYNADGSLKIYSINETNS